MIEGGCTCLPCRNRGFGPDSEEDTDPYRVELPPDAPRPHARVRCSRHLGRFMNWHVNRHSTGWSSEWICDSRVLNEHGAMTACGLSIPATEVDVSASGVQPVCAVCGSSNISFVVLPLSDERARRGEWCCDLCGHHLESSDRERSSQLEDGNDTEATSRERTGETSGREGVSPDGESEGLIISEPDVDMQHVEEEPRNRNRQSDVFVWHPPQTALHGQRNSWFYVPLLLAVADLLSPDSYQAWHAHYLSRAWWHDVVRMLRRADPIPLPEFYDRLLSFAGTDVFRQSIARAFHDNRASLWPRRSGVRSLIGAISRLRFQMLSCKCLLIKLEANSTGRCRSCSADCRF
jgi:hypothetical protein